MHAFVGRAFFEKNPSIKNLMYQVPVPATRQEVDQQSGTVTSTVVISALTQADQVSTAILASHWSSAILASHWSSAILASHWSSAILIS